MFTRLLSKPKQSAFIFGPRGTGKSTWIREHFATESKIYDLLDTGESLRMSKEPAALYREVETLSPGAWVVIDEIQKVPALLDEVHRLIETRGLNFILSGSSARKLRRGGSNLLAGRAFLMHLFPLVSAEISFDIDVADVLSWGTLPVAVTGTDAPAYLSAYTQTYLQEEIRAEALTRNIGNFSRFLEIAARQNGQLTNVAGIARDAAVSRQTVQNYFEILIDTLMGQWLLPWKLKRATKQVSHPKFYLFDCGVTRAMSGRLPYPPSQEESGPLLETFLLGELRAYMAYSGCNYPIHFWRSPEGVEVDLLFEAVDGFIAIEIKATTRWDKRFCRGLTRMRNELGEGKVTCYGVFQGQHEAQWDAVQIMPVITFLKRLWNGDLFK